MICAPVVVTGTRKADFMSLYRKPSDLPETIPVFPLTGAVLLPRWTLPLNFFEPRYLNMVDDVMSGDRVIGMIQPSMKATDKAHPELCNVGCVGRVTSYAETDDGRYLVTLSGIVRYRILEELDVKTPYRQARVSYGEYADDFSPADPTELPSRDALLGALRSYLQRNSLKADWGKVDDTPIEMLVNALCAGCPFSAREKQALIEAPGLKDRADALIALLEMDVEGGGDGWLQ